MVIRNSQPGQAHSLLGRKGHGLSSQQGAQALHLGYHRGISGDEPPVTDTTEALGGAQAQEAGGWRASCASATLPSRPPGLPLPAAHRSLTRWLVAPLPGTPCCSSLLPVPPDAHCGCGTCQAQVAVPSPICQDACSRGDGGESVLSPEGASVGASDLSWVKPPVT